MSGISFSGLSSGIDFDGLRAALLAVERQAIKRLEDKQNKYTAEKDAIRDVNGRLGNLLTKMSPILASGSSDLTLRISATSSNTGVFTATALSTAASGSYDVRVKNLALAESLISKQGGAVGAFTASVAGSDLNADIDSATTLLSSLHRRDNSANFVDGDLGQITIDDGVTNTTVDLSAALTSGNTYQDMVNYLNTELTTAGVNVTAALNASGDGLLLTSGTGNLGVDDGADGKQTATKFGVSTGGVLGAIPVDGGDLDPDLQANTDVSRLNSGAGIADLASGLKLRLGSSTATVDLSAATTVNDVLTALNASGLSLTAAIDPSKNGFSVTSTVANRSLGVEENGGTTATNFGIFGKSNVVQVKTAADASYFDVYLDGSKDGNDANLSVNDIRDSLNQVTGKTFSSSVIDGRLQLQSNSLGTANALMLKDNTANGGVFEQIGLLITDAVDDSTISNDYAGDNTKGGYLQAGVDAVFSINGLTVTRSKNTGIDDVISDVTLNLVAPSASSGAVFPTDYTASTLTIAKNTGSMASTIEEFVNQYNSVIDFLDKSVKINPDADDGVLSTNSTARGLKDVLFQRISQLNPDVGQSYRSIFEIKDDTGAYVFKVSSSKAGQIELNKTALTNVLEDEADEVMHAFRYDTDADSIFDDGVIFDLNTLVKNYNTASTGILDTQVKTYESQIQSIYDQIERNEERIARKDDLLKSQFATAEQLISSMQSQSNYLASQFSSLSR